jgi:hypothetical protein
MNRSAFLGPRFYFPWNFPALRSTKDMSPSRASSVDVLSQAELDAEREAAAVNGDDGRLGALTPVNCPRIDRSAAQCKLAACDEGCDACQVHPGREVITVREDHSAAHPGIALEDTESFAQRAEHFDVEGIELRRAVETDEEQMTALLRRDLRCVAHEIASTMARAMA